jgi:hypothetical protein
MLTTSSRAPLASANFKQAFQTARQMRLNTPTTPQRSPRHGLHLTLPQFHLYNASSSSAETVTPSVSVTPYSTPTGDGHLTPHSLRLHLDAITPPLRTATPTSTETSRLRGEVGSYFNLAFADQDESALESEVCPFFCRHPLSPSR